MNEELVSFLSSSYVYTSDNLTALADHCVDITQHAYTEPLAPMK